MIFSFFVMCQVYSSVYVRYVSKMKIKWLWKISLSVKLRIFLEVWPLYYLHTAKRKYRNFETNITNIPRKVLLGSQSQFSHSCVCDLFTYTVLYIPTIGLPILLEEILYCMYDCTYIDRPLLQIAQRHMMNVEIGADYWGRAIPRKGIHKWDFRCSA